MAWRLNPLDRAKFAGIVLDEKKPYSAQEVRLITKILNPSFIWKNSLESMMDAKSPFVDNQSIQVRIPEKEDVSFDLSLGFEMSDNTLYLNFRYDKDKGYYMYSMYRPDDLKTL